MQSNSVLYFSNAEFRQKSYGTSNYLIIVDMDFTFCFPPQSYILGQLLTCSHQYGHTGPLWQQASTCLFCYLCFPPRQGECLCLSSFCDWHVGHASYQMLVFSLDSTHSEQYASISSGSCNSENPAQDQLCYDDDKKQVDEFVGNFVTQLISNLCIENCSRNLCLLNIPWYKKRKCVWNRMSDF